MTFFYLAVSSIFRIRAPNIRRFSREGGKIFRQVFETYFRSRTVSKTPWKSRARLCIVHVFLILRPDECESTTRVIFGRVPLESQL